MPDKSNNAEVLEELAKKVGKRRTFAIISHPDAGKTTLTEKLLLYGGAIQEAGAVKARRASRHATSDWLDIEKQRGISVSSSVMQFDYADTTINLLDTPGHEDFSEDTYRVLTAVDAAVMVIDAAKGVEAQTIKLLEVCRLRNTPIITFVNKFDREVRGPLDILQEVEETLKIECAPVTWPIGMGKTFRGVYDLQKDNLLKFTSGKEKQGTDEENISGIGNTLLDEYYPNEVEVFREEVELIREASEPFDIDLFLSGMQTPVFFGSGINNFGVQEVLTALIDWAPKPQPRAANTRDVLPAEKPFTGFVFKIQANMDPKHRDRIAFFRICSGKYQPGVKAQHLRLGREMRIGSALTFMANSRVASEEAYAGDIIGIHNHGQLQIGDTLSQGEELTYTGIPYFAPELFVSARPEDPFKAKQLAKGLKELGEEGAVQVFTNDLGRMLLGAVGRLQFEIVAHRLNAEYGVEAKYEPVDIHTARWLSFPDDTVRREFTKRETASMALDVDGNPVFLASSKYKLSLTQDKWENVGFHATREHGEVLTQG